MKKLKLLFPLLGTSAFVIAPALTVQSHRSFENKNIQFDDPATKTLTYTNNNSKLYAAGKSVEYYYDYKYFPMEYHHKYTEANLNFSLTPYGATELAKAAISYGGSTGSLIMTFFHTGVGGNKTALGDFDTYSDNSYITRIETGFVQKSKDILGGLEIASDPPAYTDFLNHMSQPADVVSHLVDLYKHRVALPSVNVRFHYDYHSIAKDDFDVSFTIPTKHRSFPDYGPFGGKGNEDAVQILTSGDMGYIQFDISTTSIAFINHYYLAYGRGDTPWYGIYDFLTDAYPRGNFTDTLYRIKEQGDPSINTIMEHITNYIGTYKDPHNYTQLNLKPAFMEFHFDNWNADHINVEKNHPFVSSWN